MDERYIDIYRSIEVQAVVGTPFSKPYGTLGPPKQQTDTTALPTKNEIRRNKFQRIQKELTMLDIQWMARRGELLGPRPFPVDDPCVSSRLFGPSTKTVQLERIRVIVSGEDEQENWNDRMPIN